MLEIEISKKQNLCHIIKFIQEIKFILPIYRTHSTNKRPYITYKKYRRTMNRKRNYFFFLSLFPFLCPIFFFFVAFTYLLFSFLLFFFILFLFLFPLLFLLHRLFHNDILWENGAQQFRWITLFIRKQSSSRFFLVVSVSCKWLREDINNNESV